MMSSQDTQELVLESVISAQNDQEETKEGPQNSSLEPVIDPNTQKPMDGVHEPKSLS